MGIFKRFVNIVQSDIGSFLDKLEQRQANRSRSSNKKSYEHDNYRFRNSYKKSDFNDKADNSKSHDTKLEQYYANLEIPYGSDLETSKMAWKRLMKRYHPDLYSKDQSKVELATKLTSKLNEAFREIEKACADRK